ncbi:PREDICTED: inositol 1,4,5-trisphosphate receptor-like isoform X2 [Amphimedon queenslandica]|uniref:Ion transport domain-containing protein n=1 Tax=Amphimedon queenslandica TaxID=400682 RepID=A0AAN0JTL2_AMPQE|nr:PREDICTED: inositol 1,4,5-trisphosphate receptor-like isoform X2 [Amphimedon queenslandica]|eukprot:XP_019860384.1 PREDICTED: inositol 1,4,5-trisphosphate receptor-like isoform X2 [Amphimedon queenslandica]
MYRKLPFIRILTVTYLFDGNHFTANCSQYKKLWSHINKTIMRFVLVEDKSITSKSHWAIHQQIVDGGKYMQPDRELEHVMELLYITDGVIPFLSKVCHEMSHQSSEKHICTKEELQSLREQLELLKNYRFVLEQLNTSGHIGRINSLLEKYEINCLVATTWPASDGSINQTDSADNKIKFVRRDRSMPIEPQSNYYKEIYNLLKANNKNVRTVVILALKNLVELQKIKSLTYFKRIDVEETILRMLVLLQIVIKEAILPSEKYSLNEKKLFKSVLYLNDHSNKEHTIFHLLQSQNNEVIFQVVKMLKCFEEAPKEVGAPKKVQKKMISSCKAHDNVYIVQVHRLLREAHTIYNANHSQNDSATPDELKNTERGITAALDIIILLCDRQHRVMQDAMRNSKVFISGSNVVSQVALLLFYITEHLDENNGIIAHTAVKALVKMCTGNYNNQHIAYKGQVVTSINCILEKNGESFAELKSSCIKLLEVMLEEIDENSSKLAIFIADHLKIDKLYQEMRDLWKLKVSIEYTMEDTLKLCRVYHILKRIADYKGRNIDKLICPDKEDDEESVCSDKEDDEESGCPAKKDDEESGCPDKKDDEVHQAMWKCCEQWSRSVEIVYKLNEDKDIVTRAYFPFTPHLHIKGKNDIQLEIKRSTPQEKLLDLIKLTKAVGKTHKIKDNFRNSLCIGMFFHLNKLLLIFLTILLNLIVLFTVNTPPNYNMPDTNDGVCTANETYNETCNNSTSSSPMYFQPIWYPDIPVWSTIILGILGFIHFILAVLMVIEYFHRNGRNLTLFSCQELCYGSLKMLLGRYLVHRLHIQGPRQSNKFYKIPFFSFQPLYRIFFTICSFVAWIPYPPLSGLRYLYCLCILYPFLKFDVMSFISRAIKKSIKRLASVFLLCFIFIYIYAVISFAFLNNYFSEDRDQFCGSLLQCFFTVSRLGLLSTLGSELDIRPSDYEPDFKLYVFRTFYDLIFFIVVTTLGLSIITATLVDRFSEMREKSDEVNEDNESRCFICSIERSKFDKNFKTHVEKEHNMWNYMRFIMYVKHCCHENDHNALEKYVYEKVKHEGKESIDFFPLHRAKSLLHYKHQDSATEEQSTQLQQASEEHRRQGLVVRHEADHQTEDMRRRNTI